MLTKSNSTPKYNTFQNIHFMIRLAWNSDEKMVLVLCLLIAFLSVAQNLINLYISPVILDAVEKHVPVARLLFTIAGFVLASMAVSAALTYTNENSRPGRISVRCEIVNLLNRKAATTSYPNLEDNRFLQLLNKSNEYTNCNQEAAEAIWETLTSLLINIACFFLYGRLLAQIQPILILVILITSGTSYVLSRHLDSYRYTHLDEEAESEKRMLYLLNQAKDFGAAKDIRIFGLRTWLEELYEKNRQAFLAFHKRAEGVYLWARIADVILTFLRNGAAYAYLIYLVIYQGMDVPAFLLFFTAVDGFSSWVLGILDGFRTLHKQSLDLSTIRECLDYPEIFSFEDGISLKWEPQKSYEIRLEHVFFRYPNASQDTLKDINFTLHPGEKLAVVGLNGVGKTTLIRLICGFYDPTAGRVLLNGTDIRRYNRADYYTFFSAVFQEFSLLAATVAANVAQTEDEIDWKRVEECIEKAGLSGKISSLSRQYETCLNREVYEDAALFSGGETQRLMLARALYKNAPFIILDEPTAALDPIAEADIYEKYNEMTQRKSSIYISHRLASTRFCDRILMLDNGKILEEGTHETLLNLGGKYARLYEVQSKYYREKPEMNHTNMNKSADREQTKSIYRKGAGENVSE